MYNQKTCGRHFEWKIRWLITADVANGFIIQYVEAKFDLRLCDGRLISENEIWSSFGFNNEPRLKYSEAWEVKDGHCSPAPVDKWGCDPNACFFNFETSGTWIRRGSAAFYPGDDLDEFGDGWGKNGENLGSPARGCLMSTIKRPNLPETITVDRQMDLSWNACGNVLQKLTKLSAIQTTNRETFKGAHCRQFGRTTSFPLRITSESTRFSYEPPATSELWIRRSVCGRGFLSARYARSHSVVLVSVSLDYSGHFSRRMSAHGLGKQTWKIPDS